MCGRSVCPLALVSQPPRECWWHVTVKEPVHHLEPVCSDAVKPVLRSQFHVHMKLGGVGTCTYLIPELMLKPQTPTPTLVFLIVLPSLMLEFILPCFLDLTMWPRIEESFFFLTIQRYSCGLFIQDSAATVEGEDKHLYRIERKPRSRPAQMPLRDYVERNKTKTHLALSPGYECSTLLLK